MLLNAIKKYENTITHVLHWCVFVFAGIALLFKFAEVSAYETTKILINNPEIAEYSHLVTNGYLIFR